MQASCHDVSGYVVNSSTGEYKPVGCGSPFCPYCGPLIKKRILDDVHRGFIGEHVRACTLTLRRGDDERTNRMHNKRLSGYWHRLLTRLRSREGFSDLKFFYTLELTEKGMLHMHIMWNIWIDFYKLSQMWFECTDKTSYIVFLQDVEIRSPAGYISKYLTKSFQFDLGNRRLKRYGFSQNMERIKYRSEDKYSWMPAYAVPGSWLMYHRELMMSDYSSTTIPCTVDGCLPELNKVELSVG